MAKRAKGAGSAAGKKKRRPDKASQDIRRTKKQIAFGRKQARQRRLIWLSVGALTLVVLIILTVALVQVLVVNPAKPVAIVNGAKIRTDSFQSLVNYRRYNIYLNRRNLETSLEALDPTQEGNEFLVSFYQQQLEQIETALLQVAQDTLDELIDDALIREEAGELGLVVTEEEVKQIISDDLQRAVAPPQTAITDTEEVASPTPVPQEQIDEFYASALDAMGLSDKEFQIIIERNLLREKVQEVLASQVPTTGLVVHVQMIQTDSEEEAIAAVERIEAGEDFASIAAEVSTDPQATETGGDVGWVTTGQLSGRYGEELEELAFSLDPGEVGQVQIGEQFYVIQVVDRDENGPLPFEVLSLDQNSALVNWLEKRREEPDVQIERLLESDQIPPDPFVAPSP